LPGELEQRGFLKYLDRPEFGRKMLLAAAITPEKLKEQIFARLNTQASSPRPPEASRAST
jgi:hypothetical protein